MLLSFVLVSLVNTVNIYKSARREATTINTNQTDVQKIILFDGVCKLCHFWCRFIIKHDHRKLFKLASVQSPQGQKILQRYNLPIDHFDTMLYVEGAQAFTKSDAFIRIVKQLDYPYRFAAIATWIPAPLRNWLYDRIAKNRYPLFGKYEQCLLPNADHQQRFLDVD